jgi:hypothetical protein
VVNQTSTGIAVTHMHGNGGCSPCGDVTWVTLFPDPSGPLTETPAISIATDISRTSHWYRRPTTTHIPSTFTMFSYRLASLRYGSHAHIGIMRSYDGGRTWRCRLGGHLPAPGDVLRIRYRYSRPGRDIFAEGRVLRISGEDTIVFFLL